MYTARSTVQLFTIAVAVLGLSVKPVFAEDKKDDKKEAQEGEVVE